MTFVPWGTTGDVAVPGDFDGDRRFDFHVARNNGGQMTHYQLRTTAGTAVFPYGLSTDRFVTGDFDGDGRTDVAAVRANAGTFEWYIVRSSTGQIAVERFGNAATDFITPGDYDGDNKTDIVVWRSGGTADQTFFYPRYTFASPVLTRWGQSAGANTAPDYPVAAFTVR